MIRRLLLSAALAGGLALSAAPPAGACDVQHCPGTSTVCATFGCPICEYLDSHTYCVL